jgi:hypothetical protein
MTPNYSGGIVLPALSLAERNIALSSQGHCTAHSVLGDGAGVRMQAESWLEQCGFYVLNARHDVATMREQVVFPYGPKREHDHIFDVVVTLHDERQIAYTIKPENRTKWRMEHQMPGEDFLSHMQTVAWWVRDYGFADDTRLISETDLDPVELHNARIIAAVRESDPEAETIALFAVNEMLGGRTLHDLTLQVGLGAQGYRALLRQIRTGELIVQPGQRITPKATVFRKGTYQ